MRLRDSRLVPHVWPPNVLAVRGSTARSATTYLLQRILPRRLRAQFQHQRLLRSLCAGTRVGTHAGIHAGARAATGTAATTATRTTAIRTTATRTCVRGRWHVVG